MPDNLCIIGWKWIVEELEKNLLELSYYAPFI